MTVGGGLFNLRGGFKYGIGGIGSGGSDIGSSVRIGIKKMSLKNLRLAVMGVRTQDAVVGLIGE